MDQEKIPQLMKGGLIDADQTEDFYSLGEELQRFVADGDVDRAALLG